jgi:hypothetical protein
MRRALNSYIYLNATADIELTYLQGITNTNRAGERMDSTRAHSKLYPPVQSATCSGAENVCATSLPYSPFTGATHYLGGGTRCTSRIQLLAARSSIVARPRFLRQDDRRQAGRTQHHQPAMRHDLHMSRTQEPSNWRQNNDNARHSGSSDHTVLTV